MKLTVAHADLLPAVAACAAIADSKSPIPASGCVLLDATGDVLRVRTSNGMQSVRLEVPAKSLTAGRAFIKAAHLLSRLDAIGDGAITITVNDSSVDFRRDRARFSLELFDPKLSPPVPTVSGSVCKLDGPAFVALLGRIAPETSLDGDGPFKSGVFLDATGVQLTAWAWNGVAMVRATMDAAGSFDCLLPGVALRHLRRLFAKTKGPVDVGASGNDLFVRTERILYTTRLPEASRPPFDAVVQAAVPRSGGHSVKLARGAFAEAVRAVMAGDPKDARVSLRMVDGGLLLWGRSSKGEISEQIVPADGTLDSLSVSGTHLSIVAGFYGDLDEIELRKHPTAKEQLTIDGDPDYLSVLDPGSNDLCVIQPKRLNADDLNPNLAA